MCKYREINRPVSFRSPDKCVGGEGQIALSGMTSVYPTYTSDFLFCMLIDNGLRLVRHRLMPCVLGSGAREVLTNYTNQRFSHLLDNLKY